MVRRKPKKGCSNKSAFTVFNQSSAKVKSCQTNVLVYGNKKKIFKYRVLQEIKYLQKCTNLLIPRAPFAKLVKEIMLDLFPRSCYQRIQAMALEALQESAENYLVQFFEDASLLSLHAKRVTLMRKDMILLRRLRGRSDIINK